ncbi:MAG: DinB family protein [Bacteroidota bacterium]
MTPHETLHALEAHRRALIARLDGLSTEAVAAHPPGGGWSLAQIVEHLARIDAGLRLGAPMAGAVVRATSGARCRILRGVLGLPLRIPAPPGAQGVMPSEAPDYGAVREAWAERRADWSRRLPEADPAAVAFRHPLMGPFLLPDALAFLLAHHRHHDAQVERTLAQVTR